METVPIIYSSKYNNPDYNRANSNKVLPLDCKLNLL